LIVDVTSIEYLTQLLKRLDLSDSRELFERTNFGESWEHTTELNIETNYRQVKLLDGKISFEEYVEIFIITFQEFDNCSVLLKVNAEDFCLYSVEELISWENTEKLVLYIKNEQGKRTQLLVIENNQIKNMQVIVYRGNKVAIKSEYVLYTPLINFLKILNIVDKHPLVKKEPIISQLSGFFDVLKGYEFKYFGASYLIMLESKLFLNKGDIIIKQLDEYRKDPFNVENIFTLNIKEKTEEIKTLQTEEHLQAFLKIYDYACEHFG
tara:strand:+ start:1375 stop:2172 length:798 start_codon:yes stop_codon:yes gene_type:complete